MRQQKHVLSSVLIITVLVACMPINAFAETVSSPNYMVDQTFIGAGGQLEGSSDNYSARSSVGELGVGTYESDNYYTQAGFNTTDEPFIEFVVTASTINLGYLDTNAAKTATGTFYVRAWQAGGYSVRTASQPPTNGTAQQIAALSSPTASSPGTEQFGINLVDNASPNVGADPQQEFSFSYGLASAGYDTPDLFKYVNGDIIAQSDRSTGVTTYTVSYLYNISNVTPSGEYVFNHVMVATGTY